MVLVRKMIGEEGCCLEVWWVASYIKRSALTMHAFADGLVSVGRP